MSTDGRVVARVVELKRGYIHKVAYIECVDTLAFLVEVEAQVHFYSLYNIL